MDFKLVHFVSENWLQAIGATLFHSLWIGIILSLLTALMILLTRKASAALRYRLLTVGLCLFILAIGFTFYLELDHSPRVAQQQFALTTSNTGSTIVQPITPQAVAQPTIDVSNQVGQLLSLWNKYATQIVLVWFLIICAKAIHLLLGLNTIFYLKRNKIFESGKFWEDKLIELAQQMGISQPIKLLQSGLTQVPLVAGHFKPVILIPLGLLNGLSTAEVEAILSHELAHIKRRDYLVNLLQSFIEIVFFFNPAVLWVSKLIRTERENCCDDLALTCVPDKKNYVKALLSCQEFQLKTPAYAMALADKKSALLTRVSRMLFNTKSTLNKMEKTILTLTMVFVFLGSAAFNHAESQQTVPTQKQTIAQDTAKKKLKKPLAVKPGQSTEQSNTMIIAKPSAKEQAELDEAQARYAAAEKEYAINQKLYGIDQKKYAEAEEKRKASEKEYALHQKLYEADQKRYAQNEERRKVSERAYAQNEQRYQVSQQRYRAAQLQYQRDALRYSRDSAKFERMRKDVYPETPTSPAPYRPSLTTPQPLKPLTKPVTPVNAENLKLPPVQVNSVPEVNLNLNLASPVTPTPPQTPSKTTSSTTREGKSISVTDGGDVDSDKLSDSVSEDLLKDGLITKTEKLSYRLDKDALYINGKKQSAETHSKYKAKYLKSSFSALVYNYEVTH